MAGDGQVELKFIIDPKCLQLFDIQVLVSLSPARQTTIGFVLPEACEAHLRIVDAGSRVVVERRKQYPAGRHAETFDLDVAPGVLYYELTTPWGVLVRKMVVVE